MRPFHQILLAGLLLLPVTTASAVAQDKTVLGIELGTRFLVPACGPGDGAFPARLCFNGALINHKAWGADEHYVSLPRAGTPPYVRGEVRVSTVKGTVESVQIGTWGLEAQSGALASLTKKYGAPTRTRQQKQNALRSRFPTQFAEWDLEDFSVKLDGTTGSIDWGQIEVTTHRYRKLVEDHEKRLPKSP